MNTVADPAPLVRVRDCIARDYTRPLPLSLLAQEAGCSPFHLLRAFRRHYGVTPRDALTFVAVPALLAVVAALASAIPALRAARLDPVSAMRRD